jgi:hypothetical protein
MLLPVLQSNDQFSKPQCHRVVNNVSFLIRFQSLSKTVNVPSDGTAVVNFTLARMNVGEMIRLSIPSTPEKIPTSDPVVPPPQVANSLSGQLEKLLKEKVKKAPNLLCLYR